MNQSFEFIEDSHIYRDATKFAFKPAFARAPGRRNAQIHLVGDTYKVSHNRPYPFDMDAFKVVHAAMAEGTDTQEKVIVTPEEPKFDFDKYNGTK